MPFWVPLPPPRLWALKSPRDQQRTKDLPSLTTLALTSWPALATTYATPRLSCFSDQGGPSTNSMTDCPSKGMCRKPVPSLACSFLRRSFLEWSRMAGLQQTVWHCFCEEPVHSTPGLHRESLSSTVPEITASASVPRELWLSHCPLPTPPLSFAKEPPTELDVRKICFDLVTRAIVKFKYVLGVLAFPLEPLQRNRALLDSNTSLSRASLSFHPATMGYTSLQHPKRTK